MTLHNRKLLRLPEYDYSCEGYYFVTVCTQDRKNIFGEIINTIMILNEYGNIVNQQWIWLRNQYHYVLLDEYVVMPNHFHGIIRINTENGLNNIVGKDQNGIIGNVSNCTAGNDQRNIVENGSNCIAENGPCNIVGNGRCGIVGNGKYEGGIAGNGHLDIVGNDGTGNNQRGIVENGRGDVAGNDLRDIVGNGRDHSLQKIKPLPELMGAFKTTSSKLIHKAGLPDFRWQKSFYDHIIRNEKSLNAIRAYIMQNPLKWEFDKENPNKR